MGRLATIVERRQVGFGSKGPVYRAYHVGHGQQLARKRRAAEDDQRWSLPPDQVTRQQIRRAHRPWEARTA